MSKKCSSFRNTLFQTWIFGTLRLIRFLYCFLRLPLSISAKYFFVAFIDEKAELLQWLVFFSKGIDPFIFTENRWSKFTVKTISPSRHAIFYFFVVIYETGCVSQKRWDCKNIALYPNIDRFFRRNATCRRFKIFLRFSERKTFRSQKGDLIFYLVLLTEEGILNIWKKRFCELKVGETVVFD